MISKIGCHVYRVVFAGIIITFLFHFFFYNIAIGTAFPTLIDGTLYSEPSVSVPVNGVVLDYYVRDAIIVFVAKNEKEIVAGAYNLHDKNIIQFSITTYSKETRLTRIAFESRAIYICVQAGDSILYRADVNTGVVKQVGGVSDFLMLEDGLVILKNDNTLVYNDCILPLYFSGKPLIKGQMDNRIIFIADDQDTEVIDLKEKRVVYRYNCNIQFAISSDYTVEMTINDLPTGEKSLRVFYKIYCDGQDFGRTEPMLAINQSMIQLNLAAGQYHEIIIERWRLDETLDEYVRDNNIRQPKPVIIYVYPGRIIVVSLTYTGLEYTVVSGFKVIKK
ncbi:MAG: hypothetical protein ACUVRK_10595 [Spirochaetota bacterium]